MKRRRASRAAKFVRFRCHVGTLTATHDGLCEALRAAQRAASRLHPVGVLEAPYRPPWPRACSRAKARLRAPGPPPAFTGIFQQPRRGKTLDRPTHQVNLRHRIFFHARYPAAGVTPVATGPGVKPWRWYGVSAKKRLTPRPLRWLEVRPIASSPSAPARGYRKELRSCAYRANGVGA